MSGEVSIPLSFPTDEDGFLTQECPECQRRFMVLLGEGSDQPLSYCPYCGHHGQGCWWTEEQSEYAQSVAVAEVIAPELRKLEQAAKSLEKSTGGFLKVSVKSDVPDQPIDPPTEPLSELRIKQFRCCRERVKVEKERFHYCIICGRKTR